MRASTQIDALLFKLDLSSLDPCNVQEIVNKPNEEMKLAV